jgi:hypothetical protein
LNILSKLLGYDDEHDHEVDGPKGRKSLGPQRVTFMSNGQIRRAQVRRQKAQRRKATKRFRRDWMRNQWNVAVLRSRLQIVGAIPFADPDLVVSQDDGTHKHAVAVLTEQYGSVEAALEHYESILRERALQGAA